MPASIHTSPYSPAQIQVWLRGLLTIAWANGQFDDTEKAAIHNIVAAELAPSIDFETLAPIEPKDLAAQLRLDNAAAQNFLRMAVMVAIADGVYTSAESEKVMAFAQALGIAPAALVALHSTIQQLTGLDSASDSAEEPPTELIEYTEPEYTEPADPTAPTAAIGPLHPPKSTPGREALKPTREWLDQLSVEDPRLARFICKLVPSQCPFERDVTLFGRKVIHIPPMCKLNPLYDQLVGLRFRALSYLADDCGEDVTPYV